MNYDLITTNFGLFMLQNINKNHSVKQVIIYLPLSSNHPNKVYDGITLKSLIDNGFLKK